MFGDDTSLALYHRSQDEAEAQDRLNDEAMVARWDGFIAWLREHHGDGRMRWGALIQLAGEVEMDDPKYDGELKRFIRDYVESDGLPMMLRAFARAIEADETERRELEARR